MHLNHVSQEVILIFNKDQLVGACATLPFAFTVAID
jgi:hypothetical protein